MKNLLIRIKTLSTSFVTAAVALSNTLTLVIGSISAPGVVKILTAVVGFLTAAVAVVRRVTPVIDAEKGLLPVTDPTPAPKS